MNVRGRARERAGGAMRSTVGSFLPGSARCRQRADGPPGDGRGGLRPLCPGRLSPLSPPRDRKDTLSPLNGEDPDGRKSFGREGLAPSAPLPRDTPAIRTGNRPRRGR
ncbi:hypothetical protein GCM10010518_04210 [Kitasatospora cinereorecta]